MVVKPISENGNGLWKFLATGALAVLLGMGVQGLREPRDNVSEKELNQRLLDIQQRVDSANLQTQQKIDAQTSEIVALRASVNQQSVDIAGIASKVGVAAHPVVAPR